MDNLDTMLTKVVVSDINKHTLEINEIAHAMINDSGDEMDQLGTTLLQVCHHLQAWCYNASLLCDPESPGLEQVHDAFGDVMAAWDLEFTGAPFYC